MLYRCGSDLQHLTKWSLYRFASCSRSPSSRPRTISVAMFMRPMSDGASSSSCPSNRAQTKDESRPVCGVVGRRRQDRRPRLCARDQGTEHTRCWRGEHCQCRSCSVEEEVRLETLVWEEEEERFGHRGGGRRRTLGTHSLSLPHLDSTRLLAGPAAVFVTI